MRRIDNRFDHNKNILKRFPKGLAFFILLIILFQNMFFNWGSKLMPAGRKKVQRNICIDTEKLICQCIGPVTLPKSELKKLEKIELYPDEVQALSYKDLDNLTMQEAANKMGISKTVFAGIYSSARFKQTDCLINGKILTIQCDK